MRRLFIPAFVVPMLLFAMAVPAAAAPPFKESGTQNQLFSVSSTCSGNTCTDLILDAFMIDPETLVVCLNEFTYSTRTGRVVSETSNCDEASPEALSITGDWDVTLAETTIDVVQCNRRGCAETGETITVSAHDTATGPVSTFSDRGTFSDGVCTFRYRASGATADVAGTMTVDGVVYEQQWGQASVTTFTTTSRC